MSQAFGAYHISASATWRPSHPSSTVSDAPSNDLAWSSLSLHRRRATLPRDGLTQRDAVPSSGLFSSAYLVGSTCSRAARAHPDGVADRSHQPRGGDNGPARASRTPVAPLA